MSKCELTPAKSPRTDSLGPLSSPQPAACAPSGADLPLPSSTPGPLGLKAFTPPRKTPSSGASIRQWLSRTPGSPADQLTPPLRKVLSPCPQSPQLRHGAPSPPERRAKRRLETTADGEACCCNGDRACACVSELNPTAKRGRIQGFGEKEPGETQGGQSRDGEKRGEEPSAVDLEGKQGASSHPEADKENSSLLTSGWLAFMGRARPKGHGTPLRSPRSPGFGRKQEKKTPASPVSAQAHTHTVQTQAYTQSTSIAK